MIKQGHIAESNDRTVGPFTAVIEQYRKHARRTAAKTKPVVSTRQRRRTKVEPVALQPRVRAVIYYTGTAQQLGFMNETE